MEGALRRGRAAGGRGGCGLFEVFLSCLRTVDFGWGVDAGQPAWQRDQSGLYSEARDDG